MPYRDPPIASVGPPPSALRVGALLVGLQAIASLVLSLAHRWVSKAAAAEVSSNAAALEHGRHRYDTYWASVAKSPFWALAPWSFVGLVLIASTLVALRGRVGSRRLGIFGVGLALASVALLAAPIVLDADDPMTRRLSSWLGLLAALPVLWAASRPGARQLVWLATAAAFASVFMGFAPPRSLGSETMFVGGMLSPTTLGHGEQVGFLLSLAGFVTVAIAALVRRPEDTRGPAPASPMARATAAMLLATLPPTALALFRAEVGAWDSSWVQQGCIFVPQKLARLSDFRFVLDGIVGFAIVATVCVVVAVRALAPRLTVFVTCMAAVETGLGFLVVAKNSAVLPAWAVCASALVIVAAVLVHSARQRTLEAASRLAVEDASTIADRTVHTSGALVACSAPAIGAVVAAVMADHLADPRVLGLCGGFLGAATAVILVRAAWSYRRSASAFSELARLTPVSSDRPGA